MRESPRPRQASLLLRDLTVSAATLSGLALLLAGGRVAIDSRAHFARGQALEARALGSHSVRDLRRAAEAYTAAVASYVPFASRGHEALERIGELAERLAERGQAEAARAIVQRAAATARSLEGLYAPYAQEAARLEAMAQPSPPSP